MVVIKFEFVLLIIYFHVSDCQRRIINGSVITADKPYMVYLVKATMSDRRYDSWICGGALVTKEFIMTSAACVEDVKYMYAIAGYSKYVADKFIPYDECTKTMKKRVVYTCIPVSYQFSYDEIEKWSYIDIALVKVESPYDLDDARFQIMCSYVPKIISINYDAKRQAANTDAMVLGWGHKEFWRKRSDKSNYNQQNLRYTSVSVMDKDECKAAYQNYPDMLKTIDKYMICSLLPGNLNDVGEPILEKPSLVDGCITTKQKMKGADGVSCEVEIVEDEESTPLPHVILDTAYGKDETRKHMNLNGTNNDFTNQTEFVNGTDFENRTDLKDTTDNDNIDKNSEINGRRNGICQNDHGGPLVTWVGTREVLIGVASVFKITDENECVGPFLYTSTMCNGAFIECVLNDKSSKVRIVGNSTFANRELCDSPASVKGFDTIETFVSWKDHPGGPADNEIRELRDGKGPKKKRVDRFATRHVSAEDKYDPNNPLSDRHTQKVSFPTIKELIHLKKPVRKDKFATNKESASDVRPAKGRFETKIGPPPPLSDRYVRPDLNDELKSARGQAAKSDTYGRPPLQSGVFSRPSMVNEGQELKNEAFGKVGNNPIQSPPNADQEELRIRPQRPLRTN